jgi:hypothetical protein
MTKHYCPDHPNTLLLGRKKPPSDKVGDRVPEIMVCPIDGKHHPITQTIEHIDPGDIETD